MLDAVLNGVQQEEAHRVAINLALPGQIDLRIRVDRIRDLDQFIAGADSDAGHHVKPRPGAAPGELATLVLTAFRAQDEGLLCAHDMSEQFSDRSRGAGSARIQLLGGQIATSLDEAEARSPVVPKEVGERSVHNPHYWPPTRRVRRMHEPRRSDPALGRLHLAQTPAHPVRDRGGHPRTWGSRSEVVIAAFDRDQLISHTRLGEHGSVTLSVLYRHRGVARAPDEQHASARARDLRE